DGSVSKISRTPRTCFIDEVVGLLKTVFTSYSTSRFTLEYNSVGKISVSFLNGDFLEQLDGMIGALKFQHLLRKILEMKQFNSIYVQSECRELFQIVTNILRI
ncbi:unnamed protein product, partial [Adineta ricciae]